MKVKAVLPAFLAVAALLLSSACMAQSSKQLQLYKRIQASSNGYLDVDGQDFLALTAQPRDFAVTALLTTTDGTIKCGPCLAFQPEFDALTAQWNKNKSLKTKNVFVKVEFSRGRQVFAQYKLQHAPVLYTFPAPSDKNSNPEHASYDFNINGFEADSVASHLERTLHVTFKYKKPLNVKLIAMTVTAMIVLATAMFFLAPYLPMFLKSSKPFWMLVCLSTMIIFNSGQMWNSIRGAPYVAVGQGGKPEYIAGGFQNQYGIETQIVAGLYSLLAFSFVALTVLVPAQRDPTRQRAGVYVWSAIFLCTFSVLFVIFRMKK